MSTRDAFGGCVTSRSAVAELGKAGGRRPYALRQGLGATPGPQSTAGPQAPLFTI